jgi:hypothetical protein
MEMYLKLISNAHSVILEEVALIPVSSIDDLNV